MRHINAPRNLDAYLSSGAHYSPPGAMEGFVDYNLPPTIQQRDPNATAAYRTFVNPWGQMVVQPLVGFPSRYPHVLSGVPTDFQNEVGYISSLLGPLAVWTPQAAGRSPAGQASPAPARRGGSKSGTSNATTPASNPALPSATPTRAPQAGYGDPMQSDAQWGRKAIPPTVSALQPTVQAPVSAGPVSGDWWTGLAMPPRETAVAPSAPVAVESPIGSGEAAYGWGRDLSRWVRGMFGSGEAPAPDYSVPPVVADPAYAPPEPAPIPYPAPDYAAPQAIPESVALLPSAIGPWYG